MPPFSLVRDSTVRTNLFGSPQTSSAGPLVEHPDTIVQLMSSRTPAVMLPVLLSSGRAIMPSTSNTIGLLRPRTRRALTHTATLLVLASAASIAGTARGADVQSAGDAPYPDMPRIAPIGVRIGHYLPVPQEAKGPPIEPAKGYRLEQLGKGLYMITDNAYQSMFMVYETGVVVVDAPPPFAQYIPKAIAEVTDKPITHLIYSHSHTDHIGGTKTLNLRKNTIIIAHNETKRLLLRAKDPNRPTP